MEQGLDHMLQVIQELPFEHYWSVQSYTQLYDQKVCGTRLHHRVSTRYFNFEPLLVNCVPLTDVTYKTDAMKVHQLIHVFLKGETAETWTRTKERNQDRRLDYLYLLAHYWGEGNRALHIKEAEVLQTLLI